MADPLPPVDQVLAKEQRNQARIAMLISAIAVAEGGPEKLQDIKAPFGSGPYTYRALDKGLNLSRSCSLMTNPSR